MTTRQQRRDEHETKPPATHDESGGKHLEHQEAFAEGRSRGGIDAGKLQQGLEKEGYKETGSREGQTRKERLETQGFQGMDPKDGKSATGKPGGESAAPHEGIDVDESSGF